LGKPFFNLNLKIVNVHVESWFFQ